MMLRLSVACLLICLLLAACRSSSAISKSPRADRILITTRAGAQRWVDAWCQPPKSQRMIVACMVAGERWNVIPGVDSASLVPPHRKGGN